MVRSFAPTLWEGEERDRWSGPPLPMNKGWNRLRWDLRTDPATTFPAMILWGVRTMAPVVPPGKHYARLRVGGEVASRDLVVKRNPWIQGVTDEDLVAQYEFGVRVRDEVDRANRAVIEIRRVKGELEKRLEGVEDEGLLEAAERLRAALEGIEGEIYQVRNRSNQDPLNFPIKVNNRLANLLSMSERGDGRPGEGMVEVDGVMRGRLGGLLGRLEGVWEGELGVVNEGLRGVGTAEITIGSRVDMSWLDMDETVGVIQWSQNGKTIMRRHSVSSSTILSIGYEPDTRTLEVEFRGGRIYQYYAVPRAMFSEIMHAPSAGVFFNTYIRNAFSYSRLS